MIKKLKTTFASLMAASALLFPMAMPAMVSAQNIENNLCGGADIELNNPQNCKNSGAENRVEEIITTIINILSAIVAAIAVVMIIVGGFRYVLSGGNDSNVQSAKNTIIYALVGLVIVALAQVLVKFVLSRVTD